MVRSVTLTVLLVVCIAASGWTVEKPGIYPGAREGQRPAEPEMASYDDALGRSTPQGTVLGFIKSATRGDYERALQYLDTKTTGLKARKLIDAVQVILERGFSGKSAMLSNKTEGYLDDNLPSSKERIGTVKTPSGSLDILLERVQRGNNPAIWLFSGETLKNVPEIYKELDVRTNDTYLPKFLVNTWFLWFPLWQWLLILLLIPLSYGLSILVTRLFNLVLLFSVHRIAKVRVDHHVARLTGPIRILIFALAIWIISLLSRSVITSAFWTYVALTLTVIGATWLSVRVIDALFKLKQSQFTSSDKFSMMQLGRKLSKIMALIVGTLVIFYIAGINIAAVLTGLGIGGIAIAFAAQKTLENLFGGVMIISDRPVRVGDFCRAGDHIGTVENIGLRSTRIRTLERTVVSVPNGQLALMSLENFSMRDKIWFHHVLHLRYETRADQLRYILVEIRKMLYQHPKIETASARIRFVGFGSSSLDLEIFAYVLETSFEVFLEIQEDVLLRVMDLIEASGSGLALPSQTTYVTKDTRLNSTKSQVAIATVHQWREQGELPFPDFSPETTAEIDNRLEYPPLDSALRNQGKE
ncbi:MAG TPA: mechanosensitive ion channel family protein [Thermodesulfobacteriota bacterium]|nr:mechanosensitive ion channel family protein [Thermodesulfobacteriota bacterium]